MDNEKLKLQNEISILSGDEAKQHLYHVTLELYRYQDMTQEILDYLAQHKFTERATNELFEIIKKWETK